MERSLVVLNVVGLAVALTQSLVLVALLCQVGRIHLKRSSRFNALIVDEGPAIHARLPELELPAHGGSVWSSRSMHGKEWVLILAGPHCAPCERLLKVIGNVRRSLPKPVDFVVVLTELESGFDPRAYQSLCASATVALDRNERAKTTLEAERTPLGFLVDVDGIVRMKGIVNDREQLEGLVQRRGRYLGTPDWQPLSEAP